MSHPVLHKALLTTKTLLKLKLMVAHEMKAKQDLIEMFEKKTDIIGCDIFKRELVNLKQVQKELEEAEIVIQ